MRGETEERGGKQMQHGEKGLRGEMSYYGLFSDVLLRLSQHYSSP